MENISLEGLNIVIIGGDRREAELFRHFKDLGADVYIYGFDRYPEQSAIELSENLIDAVRMAQVIVTPLNGIDEDGTIYAPYAPGKIVISSLAFVNALSPQTLFLAGHVHPTVQETLQQKGVLICETSSLDEISILNAIPTAEGAVQAAMTNTDITIHNSQSFVLGFGRCGQVLAHTLQALGAEVTVVVRREEVLSWLEVFRMKPLLLKNLGDEACKADLIFNTIPHPVLDAGVLYRMRPDTLVIDIASSPGGVDFSTAEKLKIKVLVLPGLPGRVAPKTAGKILCTVYPELITSYLKRR